MSSSAAPGDLVLCVGCVRVCVCVVWMNVLCVLCVWTVVCVCVCVLCEWLCCVCCVRECVCAYVYTNTRIQMHIYTYKYKRVCTLMHKHTHIKPAERTLSRALIDHLKGSDVDTDTYVVSYYTHAQTHSNKTSPETPSTGFGYWYGYMYHMYLHFCTHAHKTSPEKAFSRTH